MCYSKEVSLLSLIGGIISSSLLDNFGDKKYKNTNIKISLFFSFVTLMQFVEYLIWSDINCSYGLNKLAGYIGPLLNNLQPFILYLLYHNELSKISSLKIINYIYVIYVLFYYSKFIMQENICSGLINNHISWSWSYDNFNFYFIVMILNNYYMKKDKYKYITVILSAIAWFLSYRYFKLNLGEFWCLFVVLIPIIILVIQRIDIIRMKYNQ